MSTPALLDTLQARGVVLTAAGDKLTVDAPAGTLTDIDRAAIRRHKAALLHALRRPARPVVLPPDVHEVPLDTLRALAGEDWGEIAADPALLECFTRSALLHGDLTRPEYSPDSAETLPKAPRTTLEPAPRPPGHIPLGLTPGPALDASRRFYSHLAGCSECCAPVNRYCAEGEALRQTYYTAAGEGAP